VKEIDVDSDDVPRFAVTQEPAQDLSRLAPPDGVRVRPHDAEAGYLQRWLRLINGFFG
jgi:hypothetical protein